MSKFVAALALFLFSNTTYANPDWQVGTVLAQHESSYGTVSYTCTLVSQVEGSTSWNADCADVGTMTIDDSASGFFVAEFTDRLDWHGLKIGDEVSEVAGRVRGFVRIEKLITYTQRYQSCGKDIQCKEWREIDRAAYYAAGEWHSAQTFLKQMKPGFADPKIGQMGWLLDVEPCKAIQCKSDAEDWHYVPLLAVARRFEFLEENEDGEDKLQRSSVVYLFKTTWDEENDESFPQAHETANFYWREAETYVDFKVGGKILTTVNDENEDSKLKWATITKIVTNGDYVAMLRMDDQLPLVSPKGFKNFNGRFVGGGFDLSRGSSRMLRARRGDTIRDGKILAPDETKTQDYIIQGFGQEPSDDDQKIHILDTQNNIWLGYQCDDVDSDWGNDEQCEGKEPGSYADLILPWDQ